MPASIVSEIIRDKRRVNATQFCAPRVERFMLLGAAEAVQHYQGNPSGFDLAHERDELVVMVYLLIAFKALSRVN